MQAIQCANVGGVLIKALGRYTIKTSHQQPHNDTDAMIWHIIQRDQGVVFDGSALRHIG